MPWESAQKLDFTAIFNSLHEYGYCWVLSSSDTWGSLCLGPGSKIRSQAVRSMREGGSPKCECTEPVRDRGIHVELRACMPFPSSSQPLPFDTSFSDLLIFSRESRNRNFLKMEFPDSLNLFFSFFKHSLDQTRRAFGLNLTGGSSLRNHSSR